MTNKQLLACAEEFGAPLYVYDAQQIEEAYNKMTKAFESIEHLKINYACKALSNISVLKYIKNLGAGLDTVSIQEVELGLQAGYKPEDIIFTPNGVSLEEIEDVAKKGVQINIDNLEILEEFGTRHPNIPVCVRINPHILAGGNANISVGHIDSKFGISIHQTPHLKRVIKNTGMRINGIHMHTGSDILDIGVFLSAAEILFEIAEQFTDLEFVDLGSGFKVPYREGDIYTDLDELGERLGQRFKSFVEKMGKPIQLMFEPGKYLVSQAGYFLAKVNVIKQTTSTVFASVDSGFNHLIRPMFYNAYHSISNLSNTDGRKRFYSVVGYICETDTFGVNRQINEITQGDILCFKNAGAYCFQMASNYNSRYRPAEVLFYNNEAKLIREREEFKDLIKGQIQIF